MKAFEKLAREKVAEAFENHSGDNVTTVLSEMVIAFAKAMDERWTTVSVRLQQIEELASGKTQPCTDPDCCDAGTHHYHHAERTP